MRFEPDKHLHSKEHLLADDLSRMMGELKRFAAYLGIAELYYESDLRALARRVLEKEELPVEARGKYFFAALRGFTKKPGAKLKNLRRKKKSRIKKIRRIIKMGDILPIVKEPHKVLRKRAEELSVKEMTGKKIQRLIRNMKATLAATPDGVGLAAPQVGEALAIFVVSEEALEIDNGNNKETRDKRQETRGTEKRDWNYYVFINPRLKNQSRKKLEGPEGCLSVPKKFGTVNRHEKITVEAYDETGKKFTRGASRFLARVIQHELDHLDGILFVDKAKKLTAVDKNENP